MIKLAPEPDSIIDPIDALTENMKLEGTSNDSNHNQFIAGDEVDLLGDGQSGYESTGLEDTDDELSQQLKTRPSITPKIDPY